MIFNVPGIGTIILLVLFPDTYIFSRILNNNKMTLNYPKAGKTEKTIEVLNDLLKINNDRIAGYQKALEQSTNIDISLREEFKKIISESIIYRQQLIQEIGQNNGDAKTGTTIFGKIYRAWMDLKVAFAGNTQKTILSSCLYNEEIALHVYKAALNVNADLSKEIREMIEEQEDALRKAHIQIKNYREARHIMDLSLLYFN